MNHVSENCINCAIGVLFNFSGFMGISTITSCNHANNQIVQEKLPLFNLKRLSATFSLLLIAVSNYYATKRTCEAIENGVLLFNLLLIFFDVMLYAIATITIIQGISQCERLNRMFIFFDSIIKEFTTHTSHRLLSTDDVVSFRTRTYISLTGICFFYSTAPIFMFCLELNPDWNVIERFGLLISVYDCVMLIVVALVALRISYYVNNRYKRFLKMDLDNLIADCTVPACENENCSVVNLPRPNVKNLLKVYADTYIEIIKVLKTFNKCCNPIILILVIFIIIFCIATVFLVVVCVVYDIQIGLRFLSVQCGMQFIIAATGYSIITFAKSNTLNGEILTLLRKFPMSKLSSPDENLQFDSFLHMVKRYQVNFEASEIVSVDIPLFASILATVLTYVLVAVQFQFL